MSRQLLTMILIDPSKVCPICGRKLCLGDCNEPDESQDEEVDITEDIDSNEPD